MSLFISDIINSEMQSRFGSAQNPTLYIIPSCVVSPRWRYATGKASWLEVTHEAMKAYEGDLPSFHSIKTELTVWSSYWWVTSRIVQRITLLVQFWRWHIRLFLCPNYLDIVVAQRNTIALLQSYNLITQLQVVERNNNDGCLMSPYYLYGCSLTPPDPSFTNAVFII